MNLSELIQLHKGAASYADLAKRSDGALTQARFQQLGSGNAEITELPKPSTIVGIAKALRVRQEAVVLAAMESCPYLDNPETPSSFVAALPPGTAQLTEAQAAWLHQGIRLLTESLRATLP